MPITCRYYADKIQSKLNSRLELFMKKLILSLLLLFGATRNTLCEHSLEKIVAFGSAASFVLWTPATLNTIITQGLLFGFASTLVPRLILDSVTVTNMLEIMSTSKADRATIAFSCIGSAASFLFWLPEAKTKIERDGFVQATASTHTLRLGLDVLTLAVCSKYLFLFG